MREGMLHEVARTPFGDSIPSDMSGTAYRVSETCLVKDRHTWVAIMGGAFAA